MTTAEPAHTPEQGEPEPYPGPFGTDGGVARELSRHRCIKKIVLVEIDAEVVSETRSLSKG